MTLGQRVPPAHIALRKHRLSRRLSVPAFAEIAGVCAKSIAEYERGTRSPRLDVLQRIAKDGKTTVGEILGEVPMTEQERAVLAAMRNYKGE